MDKGLPFRKSFSVKHTVEGFENLLRFLKEIERVADGKQPSIILESTGHYHSPVIQFLEEQQYTYIILNPLISHRANQYQEHLSQLETEIDALAKEIEEYKII